MTLANGFWLIDCFPSLVDLSQWFILDTMLQIFFALSIHTTVDGDKLILDVFLVQLTFHLTRSKFYILQTVEFTIIGSVLLKVDVSILHDVQVSHVLSRLGILPLLVFDEVGSFKECILQPKLNCVEKHWHHDYYRDDLEVHIPLEHLQQPDNLCDQIVTVDVL